MFDLTILEKNLRAIRNYFPKVYWWLEECKHRIEDIQDKVCKNRWNLPDYIYKEKSLLMEDIPLGIYKTWVSSSGRGGERRLSVLIGSSVGYGMEVLLKKTSDVVMVIEPHKELLLAALGILDISPFVCQRRLFFSLPSSSFMEDILGMLSPFVHSSSYRILIDPSYGKNHRDIEDILTKIKKAFFDIQLYLRTANNRQEEMVKNEIANYYKTFEHGSLFPLKERFKGCYGIIIGAGPSLKRHLPGLARVQKKAFLFTSFQTLPVLFEAGITPTLVMVLDYSKVLEKVFDKVDMEWLREIPLVYSPKVRPEIVDKYPGIKIPLWTEGGLGTYLRRDRELVINSGGNVSVGLIRLLYEIGFRIFFLVGQDFSWRGEKTHVSGHHASENGPFPLERSICLKNLEGEEIFSAGPYLTAVHEIEKDLGEKRDMTVYNLYGGGVVIKGALNIEWDYLKKYISSHPQEEAIINFLREIKRCARKKLRPLLQLEGEEWKRSLRAVSGRLSRLFKRPWKRRQEISNVYMDILRFLLQHPLYTPYISPEIMEISHLALIKETYKPCDLRKTARVFRQIQKKVKEIDIKLQN